MTLRLSTKMSGLLASFLSFTAVVLAHAGEHGGSTANHSTSGMAGMMGMGMFGMLFMLALLILAVLGIIYLIQYIRTGKQDES